MYRKIKTSDMSHEDWLRLRKMGIGGSDAGAICGLNPYSSPMKVYQEKISTEVTESDNEAMRIGHDLEDYVAQRFMEATGLKVRKSGYMYQSCEHPFMIADVDRLVVGEDAGLECKTASAYHADKWKDGKAPAHYIIQCCHYMAVTGRKAWYLAVVILGVEFKFIKIEWDEELIRNLIRMESDFWNNHVAPKTIPLPDGSKVCDEVLEQYFHTSKKGSAIPLTGFDTELKRHEELVGLIKKMETEKQKIEQRVKLFLGEHETAFNEEYRVSWPMVESSRLDAARLKEEKPEIYREYLRTTSSRRLQIKAA